MTQGKIVHPENFSGRLHFTNPEDSRYCPCVAFRYNRFSLLPPLSRSSLRGVVRCQLCPRTFGESLNLSGRHVVPDVR